MTIEFGVVDGQRMKNARPMSEAALGLLHEAVTLLEESEVQPRECVAVALKAAAILLGLHYKGDATDYCDGLKDYMLSEIAEFRRLNPAVVAASDAAWKAGLT